MKKINLIFSAMFLAFSIFGQVDNVGIGTTTPNNSAVLDVTSTTMGLLIPRMTTIQRNAIASPSNSLLVFDTDSTSFWYYDTPSTSWKKLGSGGGGGGGTLDDAYDFGGAGLGRTITADANAVQINIPNASSTGLKLNINGASAIGFDGDVNTSGVSIRARSLAAGNTFPAIQGETNSTTTTNAAITGNSTGAASGVAGQVISTGTAFAAVFGNNLRTTGGVGVSGIGFNGVAGETNYRQGYGVWGQNSDAIGPLTANSIGVVGFGYVGVWGQSIDPTNGAGLYSNDNFIAAGTKSFQIDHPLDAENKYLRHFCMESSEVLNVYRGNVTLDNNGEATVVLPHYFSSININFSYQLTAIGEAAPGIFVKKEVYGNQFSISGGKPGMKISWTLYAERNDLYMQKYPEVKKTEVLKREADRGKYTRPELYNQPATKGIFYNQGSGKKQPELQLMK